MRDKFHKHKLIIIDYLRFWTTKHTLADYELAICDSRVIVISLLLRKDIKVVCHSTVSGVSACDM